MIACATIVAKSFLSFARVLARSFREHHPGVPFLVLLADEVDGYFDPSREPFELISLRDLPAGGDARMRFHYAQQPLTYALTPYLLAHLFGRGVSRLVFIKQESLVLGELTPVFELLNSSSIVMTPHLVAPLDGEAGIARELNILQSGSFNVGLLGVSAGTETDRFLRWWQDRVSRHCRHAVREGMHYEQRWLDLVPALFDGVHVLREPAFNVGHWSLPERSIRVRGNTVLVDGEPCRLFRFSGYDPDDPHWITKHSRRLTSDNVGDAGIVFERFRSALYREGFAETRGWPYAYANFDNGTMVPEAARTLLLTVDDGERFGDPFRTDGPDSYAHWLNQAVDAPCSSDPGLTRLWYAVYASRPDLQHAFPDVLRADRQAFLDWAASTGTSEHGIPRDFLPPRTA